eukprot:6175999-Pleurochrysis_carterae.AAC.2
MPSERFPLANEAAIFDDARSAAELALFATAFAAAPAALAALCTAAVALGKPLAASAVATRPSKPWTRLCSTCSALKMAPCSLVQCPAVGRHVQMRPR